MKTQPNRFRTQYDETKSVDLGIECNKYSEIEDRRTKSEFADDCDVNLIVGRYRKTGILPQTRDASQAIHGDFSEIPSRIEMFNLVQTATEAFAALPAAVRKEFDHDPAQFLAASETAEGRALLKKHGLGKPEAPTPSPASPEAPASGGQPDPKSAKEPQKPTKSVD